jgi:hypothetical protein
LTHGGEWRSCRLCTYLSSLPAIPLAADARFYRQKFYIMGAGSLVDVIEFYQESNISNSYLLETWVQAGGLQFYRLCTYLAKRLAIPLKYFCEYS